MNIVRRGSVAIAAVAATGLVASACGAGNSGDSGDGLIVGTTDKIVSIDPAGAYDTGSTVIQPRFSSVC